MKPLEPLLPWFSAVVGLSGSGRVCPIRRSPNNPPDFSEERVIVTDDAQDSSKRIPQCLLFEKLE